MKLTKIVTTVALATGLVSGTAFAASPASGVKSPAAKRKPSAVDRPPQFVILAFDGSYSNEFWQESMDFADSVKTRDTSDNQTALKFTYFVNPPYYVKTAARKVYTTPGLNRTVSCIGWGEKEEDIVPRIDLTARAKRKGHEIGSHANAHCDQTGQDRDDPMYGHPWGLAEWTSEFKQFNRIFFDLFAINNMKPSASNPGGLGFDKSEIVGFRAPKLAHTPSMWTALKDFGFRYDTSKSSEPTYWPRRHSETGIWNFPLAEIKIAGTNKTTYSMDYNWLCRQSGCATKPGLTEDERQRFKKQMLDSYKYYFKKNYFGGRGPIHIGHHFSKWNKGAYWEAMKDFANFVCGKPGVKCVTYREYANWLEQQPSDRLASYREGDFNRLPDDGTIKDIATPVLADVRVGETENGFEAMTDLAVKDKMEALGWSLQLSTNFIPLDNKGTSITKKALVEKFGAGTRVTVRASIINREGAEVNWETLRIDKLGTAEERVSEPLELRAMQGETAEAHTIAE